MAYIFRIDGYTTSLLFFCNLTLSGNFHDCVYVTHIKSMHASHTLVHSCMHKPSDLRMTWVIVISAWSSQVLIQNRAVIYEGRSEEQFLVAVLHAALHCRLCMLMLQMMMPHKGCIDVTMLWWRAPQWARTHLMSSFVPRLPLLSLLLRRESH